MGAINKDKATNGKTLIGVQYGGRFTSVSPGVALIPAVPFIAPTPPLQPQSMSSLHV